MQHKELLLPGNFRFALRTFNWLNRAHPDYLGDSPLLKVNWSRTLITSANIRVTTIHRCRGIGRLELGCVWSLWLHVLARILYSLHVYLSSCHHSFPSPLWKVPTPLQVFRPPLSLHSQHIIQLLPHKRESELGTTFFIFWLLPTLPFSSSPLLFLSLWFQRSLLLPRAN